MHCTGAIVCEAESVESVEKGARCVLEVSEGEAESAWLRQSEVEAEWDESLDLRA